MMRIRIFTTLFCCLFLVNYATATQFNYGSELAAQSPNAHKTLINALCALGDFAANSVPRLNCEEKEIFVNNKKLKIIMINLVFIAHLKIKTRPKNFKSGFKLKIVKGIVPLPSVTS